MYYEVYVDTLFLVNFVMNLYLLMLTNQSTGRTATRLRMVAAAAVGAGIYLAGFILTFLPALPRLLLQMALASLLMIKIAFRPQSMAGYKKLLERLLSYSFFVGGALYMLIRHIEGMADYSFGIFFVMGVGGLLYLLCSYLAECRKKATGSCLVTLCVGETREQVRAIVDTGNGLVEPISGKPVSVADRKVLERLWPQGLPAFYRVIPYHSIGEAKGILQGYLIEMMIVEQEGIANQFEQVYVAAGKEEVSSKGSYEMILNPGQLQK